MGEFTIEELWRMLRESAGEPERPADADADFGELGYDSLVLLEVAARVSREYGVGLPDAEVFELRTPAAFVAAVQRGGSRV